jgi:hypothetical protein
VGEKLEEGRAEGLADGWEEGEVVAKLNVQRNSTKASASGVLVIVDV